jgi:hypothetical protein
MQKYYKKNEFFTFLGLTIAFRLTIVTFVLKKERVLGLGLSPGRPIVKIDRLFFEKRQENLNRHEKNYCTFNLLNPECFRNGLRRRHNDQ